MNGVNLCSPVVSNQRTVNFGNNRRNQQYENPINRGTERNLAILSSVGISALIGTIVGCASSAFFTDGTKKWPIIAGIGTALGALGLILPSKLYNTKVRAYTREKEMDVFSRQKTAQNNIYEDINGEIKDDDVSLDTKINHYTTVKMADNGNGVMIKGV